jgi:hypothetical protein
MDLKSQADALANRLERNSSKSNRGAGGYPEPDSYWHSSWCYMRRWIDDQGCLPSGEHVVPYDMQYPDRRRHIVRWGLVLKINFTKLQNDPEYALAPSDHMFMIPARYRNRIKLSAAQARVLQLIDALSDGPWRGHRFERLPRHERRWPTLMMLQRLRLIERGEKRMGGGIYHTYWQLTEAGREQLAKLPPLGQLPPEYTRISPSPWNQSPPPPDA